MKKITYGQITTLLLIVWIVGVPYSAGRYYATVPPPVPRKYTDSDLDHRTNAMFLGGVLWPLYWPARWLYHLGGGK